jgi:hypothetical protein
MPKKSLRALQQRVPTPDEYQAAWQEVFDAPARAAVIVAAALIERKLKELILGQLAPGLDKGDKDLFGPMKPLSSFSAKIRLGYGLRLYGDRTYHDLDLLREMRNLFAHGPLSMDFNTPEVKNEIEKFYCHSRNVPDPRQRFVSVATLLISHLALRQKDAKQGVKGLD